MAGNNKTVKQHENHHSGR